MYVRESLEILMFYTVIGISGTVYQNLNGRIDFKT